MARQLPIRREEPAPDDAVVVVRAGVMAPETIVATATDAYDDYGIHLVSVEAALDMAVDELCRTSPRIGERYGRVRTRPSVASATSASFCSPRSTVRTSTSSWGTPPS